MLSDVRIECVKSYLSVDISVFEIYQVLQMKSIGGDYFNLVCAVAL